MVDFNPFNHTTDSLLFNWDELNEMIPECIPQLRLVDNSTAIQPSHVIASRLPKVILLLLHAITSSRTQLIYLLERIYTN